MAGSQDDRTSDCFSCIGLDAHYFFVFNDDSIHTGFEMHFASTFENGVAHVLDDTWEFVRTDVRMGIYQNRGTCSMLAEDI